MRRWTEADIAQFRADHEAVLARWRYPAAIEHELRECRERWLAGVKR